MNTIYLDNAATSKPSQAALAAFADAAERTYGNPSSLHTVGKEARLLLEDARATVAAFIGATPSEITFTSGGTESNALAIQGLRHQRGKHVITTSLEHAAVTAQVASLAQLGWAVTTLSPDRHGRISADSVRAALRPETDLVTCMLVCNETGAVLPLSDITALRSQVPHVLFHTDAVQALGKLSINVTNLGVDTMSLSAHKVGGLRGVGALYVRKGVRLTPLWQGGGQEAGHRAGTEAVPLIAAFAAALRQPTQQDVLQAHLDYTLRALQTHLPAAFIIPPHDAPHILALAIPGCPGQVVQRMLSDEGIYVSTGSACSKGKLSPVLKSLPLPKGVAAGAIRVSMGVQTTEAEIDTFVTCLTKIAARLAG